MSPMSFACSVRSATKRVVHSTSADAEAEINLDSNARPGPQRPMPLRWCDQACVFRDDRAECPALGLQWGQGFTIIHAAK